MNNIKITKSLNIFLKRKIIKTIKTNIVTKFIVVPENMNLKLIN
jgi:hypothetical protein